jgi:hypothetical protein
VYRKPNAELKLLLTETQRAWNPLIANNSLALKTLSEYKFLEVNLSIYLDQQRPKKLLTSSANLT